METAPAISGNIAVALEIVAAALEDAGWLPGDADDRAQHLFDRTQSMKTAVNAYARGEISRHRLAVYAQFIDSQLRGVLP